MNDGKIIVRTRMAPSPTGDYHIGHIRSCLYNYALAKKFGGQFIIRIEDTDQVRFVPGAEQKILQVIKDYGLSWDEGPDIGGPHAPYRQTERLDIYQKYVQELLDKGFAYYSFSTPEELEQVRKNPNRREILRYDRKWLSLTPDEIKTKISSGEKYVIRLKVPDNQVIEFDDLIRGLISINSNEVDDQVLIKSDGIPTYHFAVTIDDHLMGITHVLRGEEWIVSTPKQVLLYKYLGWSMPIFAHLTVFLDPSGSGKMSKRKGSVSAQSFLDEGYLPESLLNFMMLLGWNPGDNREFYTLDEFVEAFDLSKLHKKAPIFDRKKLDYFNGHYLRQKDNNELLPLYKKFLPYLSDNQLTSLVPITKERITKLSDLPELCKFLYQDFPAIKSESPEMIQKAIEIIEGEDFKEWYEDTSVSASLKGKFMVVIQDNNWKVGEFFKVLRIAISGQQITPPIVESLPILGKDKVLSRLKSAL